MGTLGTLAVSIVGDQRAFEKSMDTMKKRTQDLGKNMQNMGKRVGRTGSQMTKFVTGPLVAAGAGVFGLGVKMGNTADEILDLSSATGMSTEAIQEWRAVADRAGVSTDAVAKASEMLTKSMSRGAEGSADMRLAMEDLGLSMDEVREMSPDERMETLITSLQGVDDAGRRAELGNRLLRNGYQDLAPMLDMTEEEMRNITDAAHENGRVMSEEQLQAADEFRQGLDKLKGEMKGLFYTIMGDLIPVLKDELFPVIKETIMPAIKGFADSIANLIKWFVDLDPIWKKIIVAAVGFAIALGPILMIVGKIIAVVGTITSMLPVLGAAFAAITLPIGLAIAAIAAAIAIGWYLYNNWDEIKEKITKLWESFKNWFVSLWENLKDWFFGLVTDIVQYHINNWTAMVDGIKAIFTGARDFIVNIWNSVSDRTRQIWHGIRNTITSTVNGIRDGMVNAFDRAKNRILSIWNSIYQGIRRIINRIIRALNRFIRGANRLSFDIPSWVPRLGGKSFGLNIPQIPTLHTGTPHFRPPGGADEGLAMLQRGEKVTPRGQIDTGGETFNFERMFEGANINIRSDEDIRKIAKEIHSMFKSKSRGQGVLT